MSSNKKITKTKGISGSTKFKDTPRGSKYKSTIPIHDEYRFRAQNRSHNGDV